MQQDGQIYMDELERALRVKSFIGITGEIFHIGIRSDNVFLAKSMKVRLLMYHYLRL